MNSPAIRLCSFRVDYAFVTVAVKFRRTNSCVCMIFCQAQRSIAKCQVWPYMLTFINATLKQWMILCVKKLLHSKLWAWPSKTGRMLRHIYRTYVLCSWSMCVSAVICSGRHLKVVTHHAIPLEWILKTYMSINKCTEERSNCAVWWNSVKNSALKSLLVKFWSFKLTYIFSWRFSSNKYAGCYCSHMLNSGLLQTKLIGSLIYYLFKFHLKDLPIEIQSGLKGNKTVICSNMFNSLKIAHTNGNHFWNLMKSNKKAPNIMKPLNYLCVCVHWAYKNYWFR